CLGWTISWSIFHRISLFILTRSAYRSSAKVKSKLDSVYDAPSDSVRSISVCSTISTALIVWLAIERVYCVSVSRLSNQLFRSEEHTSELQSRFDLVCRLL